MTNRDRMGHREAGGDWAEQVPRHDQPRGPYEDYGWARGESVLPEFRDPRYTKCPTIGGRSRVVPVRTIGPAVRSAHSKGEP
jgi:hypothetical protein